MRRRSRSEERVTELPPLPKPVPMSMDLHQPYPILAPTDPRRQCVPESTGSSPRLARLSSPSQGTKGGLHRLKSLHLLASSVESETHGRRRFRPGSGLRPAHRQCEHRQPDLRGQHGRRRCSSLHRRRFHNFVLAALRGTGAASGGGGSIDLRDCGTEVPAGGCLPGTAIRCGAVGNPAGCNSKLARSGTILLHRQCKVRGIQHDPRRGRLRPCVRLRWNGSTL